MKKNILFAILFFTTVGVYAQVPATVYIGAGPGTPAYTSLTGAAGLFNAINTNTLTADVTAIVQGNTVEDGTVSLNQFTPGYKLNIIPASATVYVLEATAANVAIIKLAGADDVTIDGNFSNTGQYLRFINNNATATNTGPVISFTNDARRNRVMNTILESNATFASNPVMLFGATTTTGNDSNTVYKCLFTNSTGTNPGGYSSAIGASGTATGDAKSSNLRIIKNNFTGWHAASTSLIDFSTATGTIGDSISVDSNKVYNNISMTGGWNAISMQNTSKANSVSYNSIGGSNPDRSGNPIQNNSGATFRAIKVTAASQTIPNNIQGNIISNITGDLSRTSNVVVGIEVTGRVDVGTIDGNTIGGYANAWDSVTTAYDNGWITIAGGNTDTINVANNIIDHANYWRKKNDRNCGILINTGFKVNVYNNRISNMFGNAYTNSTSFQLFAIRSANATANNIVNIYNNTIYGLVHNYDTTSASDWAALLYAGSVATSVTNIYNNLIYDLQDNQLQTGALAATVSAIKLASIPGLVNVYNNQVSLATQNGNSTKLRGILESSSNTLMHRISYNTVYIGGSVTGALAIDYSTAFLRSGTGISALKNNLFYNERTGDAGAHYAMVVASVTNWKDTSANHNLYVTADASKMGKYGAVDYNFSSWKTVATGDTSSYATTNTALVAANLFVNKTNDLNIITANPECWAVNGKGLAGVFSGNVATDLTGDSRSIISGIPTDIGADEFNTSTTPPSATASAAPAVSTTTTYSLSGRKLAEITWGPAGTPPTSIDLKYYSGTPPVAAPPQSINSYFDLQATGGSGYSYSIKLYYTDAEKNNIPDAILKVIKKTGAGPWGNASGTPGIDPAGKYVTSDNTLNSFSLFSLSDAVGIVPTRLISFTGSLNTDKTVNLQWSVAEQQGVQKYIVEKTTDGRNFAVLNTTNATGLLYQTYSSGDMQPLTGKNYYRLKIIEGNRSTYSNVVIISLKANESVILYPLPAKDLVTLEISKPELINTQSTITNIEGKTIKTFSITRSMMQVDISSFLPGVYFMRTADGNTYKIVKE